MTIVLFVEISLHILLGCEQASIWPKSENVPADVLSAGTRPRPRAVRGAHPNLLLAFLKIRSLVREDIPELGKLGLQLGVGTL